MAEPDYFVYVIGADELEPVKVGIAKNLKKRVKDMQTGNPYELKVLDSFGPMTKGKAVEFETHMLVKYHEKRVRRNGEWFYISPKLVRREFKSRERMRPDDRADMYIAEYYEGSEKGTITWPPK